MIERAVRKVLDGQKARLGLAMGQKKIADWYRRGMLGTYDQVNPDITQGNLAGRTAVAAAYRKWSRVPGAAGGEMEEIWKESFFADGAGCDDALYLYVHARNGEDYGEGINDVLATASTAERGMEAGKYPAYFQYLTAIYAAKLIGEKQMKSNADKTEIARLVDRSRGLFDRVIADPDLPQMALVDLFEWTGQASIAIDGDRKVLCAPLFEQLQKSKVDRGVVLTVQGTFNLVYGWEARDPSFPNRDHVLTERFGKAATALNAAWQVDHSNAFAASRMILVALDRAWDRCGWSNGLSARSRPIRKVMMLTKRS